MPSSKQAADGGGSASRLENIRKLKEQAYTLIDSAISIETDGAAHADFLVATKLAKEFYRRGVAKLEAFMRAPLPIDEQSKAEAQTLRGRVRPTLDMARERLHVMQAREDEARKSSARAGYSGSALKQPASRKVSTSGGQGSFASSMDLAIVEQIIPPGSIRVSWDSVVGLESAKQDSELQSKAEALVSSLGVLLFGPPGTGKTYLAKAVASEARCTFISVSAATLTSKYVGESEKMVKSLFDVARRCQPAIVFLDEIDSLLTKRGESTEHEASRRLKTEFLLQFDGIGSRADERILLLAATNRPSDLDEAVRRRFGKRIHVPLPVLASRLSLIRHLLRGEKTNLTDTEMAAAAKGLEGYSASDVAAVVKDAALGPIRELGKSIFTASTSSIRPIVLRDLSEGAARIKSSVDAKAVRECEAWDGQYGAV